MKSLSTNSLYQNLKRKGINTSYGDGTKLNSYNYYQVINAYKPLFITDVKNIDQIKNDFSTNSLMVPEYIRIFALDENKINNDLYIDVLKKICKRYDKKVSKVQDMETLIKSKKYILHIYSKKVYLNDFILMYKLEHTLRNFLLKYVLRIEEDIKTIFSNSLANSGFDSNFLLNINNYDVKDDSSIKSLIKILKKNQNKHSNPIKRKKSQNIIPPFWILINEFTMGELSYAINSLKNEVSNSIAKELTKHFTNLKNPNKKQSGNFLNLLSDISKFRNDLAHNNPIFLYNIDEFNLIDYPNIKYRKPRIKNFDTLDPSQQKIRLNASKKSILDSLITFYGKDNYNKVKPSKFNINLSYIIYIIYKITSIIDRDNDFHDSISKIYTKYNLYKLGEWGETKNFSVYQSQLTKLNEQKNLLQDALNLKTKTLKTSGEVKKVVKSLKREIRNTVNLLQNIEKNNVVKPIIVEENSFNYINTYYNYTGINKDFFGKINK
jgi:hypothetical protein